MTAWSSVKKKLWRANRIIRSRLGIKSKLISPDRSFQEDVLLPRMMEQWRGDKVLYVGVAWYTYHYWRRYFRGIRLTTLDISPEQAVFGAKDHVVGGLSAPMLAARAPFDMILMPGVLGYGINSDADLREALACIHNLLRLDGNCFVTVEEPLVRERPATINADEMVATSRECDFDAQPVSDWFTLTNGVARTRYYSLARVRL